MRKDRIYFSVNAVRMCVVCRVRDKQKNLIRLKIEKNLRLYNGYGRSFYLCKECIFKESIYKNIKKIAKEKISIDGIKEQLKEIQKICQQL